MAISDSPQTPSTSRWWQGKGSRFIPIALIVVLIAAVLLLPPISIVKRIDTLGMQSIGENGGVISESDGTQIAFVKGTVKKAFRARLTAVPRVAFLEGSAGKELLAAAKAIPQRLVAKSPYYQLSVSGPAPSLATWVVPIPNDSEPYQTLDVYAWNAKAKAWQWQPHRIIREDDQIESKTDGTVSSLMIVQTNPLPAVVSTDASQAAGLPTESQGALAQVHPTGLFLGGNGGIDGNLDPGFDKLGSAYGIVPIIRNYSGPVVRSDLFANMLIDPAQRTAHIDNLAKLAVGNLYSGVELDYRGLDPSLKADYVQFLKLLAAKLHGQNKTLAVRVETPTQVAEDRWDTGPYDWSAISTAVDVVKVPAPVDPQAFSAGGRADALLAFAVGQVDRTKLQIVLSGRSIEQAGAYFLQKTYADALNPLVGRISADPTVVKPGESLNLALVSSRPASGLVYDPNIGCYVYRYQDDQGVARTVWLENAASLSHKLNVISKYNIRGFTLENLPADGQDKDLWTLMRNYQQGKAQPIKSDFTVEWTVKGSAGQTVSQVRPLSDPRAKVSAPSDPGDLQVQAAIIDRGQVVRKETTSGISVATPTPQATATPEATPVPTPGPAEATIKNGPVNVRSGPGTAYPKVGEASEGAVYPIKAKTEANDWFQIAMDGKDGWVSSQFVDARGDLDAVQQVRIQAATPAPAAAAPAAAAPVAAAAAAPAPAPAAAGAFGYGIQVDPYGVGVGAVTGLGFNWLKIQVPWKDFEGTKGVKSFPEGILNTAHSAGVNTLASIVKSPNWARNPSFGFAEEGPPQNPQDYADYVGAFAKHYCGTVEAIEVWNEENLSREWGNEPLDAARYMQLLKAAYGAIKSNCPSMIVVSGAPTPAGTVLPAALDDVGYLEAMYQNGLKNYCDAVGAHPSGFANPPDMRVEDFQAGRYKAASHADHRSFYFRNTLESYRNVMVKYGDSGKRIWLTEFGWGSTSSPHPGYEYEARVSESQQAEWIVKAYQLMKSWGYIGTAILWNLDYNVTAKSTELAAFGIMGRPAYSALKAMPK
jgi:uncharacterized protein YraI